MSNPLIMNNGEIESYIDLVRKAQYSNSEEGYLDEKRLEHIKVLALLTIAQKLDSIDEFGIDARRQA